MPGSKHKPNGYIIEILKLIKESLINIICVFIYTAQKQEIKYQKKNNNIYLKKKNRQNFKIK